MGSAFPSSTGLRLPRVVMAMGMAAGTATVAGTAMAVAMETGMAAATAVTKAMMVAKETAAATAMAMEVPTATVLAVATQEAGIAVARLAGAPEMAAVGASGTLMEADVAVGLELLAMAAEMAMLEEAPGAAMLAVQPEVPQEAAAEMGIAAVAAA
jgi:hypothetical protein